MKKILFIFLLFLLGCATFNKTLKQTPLLKDSTTIDTCEEFITTPILSKHDKKIRIEYEKYELTKTTVCEPAIIPIPSNKVVIAHKEANVNISKSKDVTIGEVVYKIPDTMIYGKSYQILVRIAKNKDTAIYTKITGKVAQSNIKVSSKMDVNLKTYDSAFSITSIGNTMQLIDDEYTEWQFNVVPLKDGTNVLILVVSVVEGDNSKDMVYNDSVYVKTDMVKVAEGFWRKYWQYFLSTFIIPIFVFFYKRNKKDGLKNAD